MIARQRFGFTVGVVGRPDLAIKYAANCASLNTTHPLVLDYLVRAHLQRREVTTNVYFISSPIKLDDSMTGHFSAGPEQLAACIQDPRSTLYYSVVEMDHSSVHAMMKNHTLRGSPNVPFAEVLQFLELGIDALRVIHQENGIAHGNVNPRNVIIGANGTSVVLTYFEHALLIEDEYVEGVVLPSGANSCFSRLGGAGSPQGLYRDEVIRLFMVGAYMIHGKAWMGYCNRLAEDPAAMLALKNERNLFIFMGRPDPLAGLPPDRKEEIAEYLEKALAYARTDGEIDYGKIRWVLRNARRHAEGGSCIGCVLS